MANYKISELAKVDLIRIYQFGLQRFGETQAEKYYNTFFEYFELIAKQPHSFEAITIKNKEFRKCVCGSDTIFYRVSLKEIEIISIVGNQDINIIF